MRLALVVFGCSCNPGALSWQASIGATHRCPILINPGDGEQVSAGGAGRGRAVWAIGRSDSLTGETGQADELVEPTGVSVSHCADVDEKHCVVSVYISASSVDVLCLRCSWQRLPG